MINLGHFVIGRKHEFCVIDLFEIDASLNLSANFDRSALRVLLQNDGELAARWYPLLYQRDTVGEFQIQQFQRLPIRVSRRATK
jgi:hypothetical protein